jgi:signal transduction histidine kinase
MLSEGLAGKLTPEQCEYVKTILGKADHLLQLITGILDVSLIEARSLRLNKEPVDMAELIRGVADTMARDLERRNLSIEVSDDDLPRAMGDSRKLRQVVLHLLANAIKFSPEGGDVAVSIGVAPLSPDDSSSPTSPFWADKLPERFGVLVTVSDQGIGIPAELRSSIFEPFYQVDSSSTRAFGGTGLGLSLARSYVVAHGGFLWVDEAPGGRGSRFTFSLPAVSSELEAYVARLKSSSSPSAES